MEKQSLMAFAVLWESRNPMGSAVVLVSMVPMENAVHWGQGNRTESAVHRISLDPEGFAVVAEKQSLMAFAAL